jgi:hypothetical protein
MTIRITVSAFAEKFISKTSISTLVLIGYNSRTFQRNSAKCDFSVLIKGDNV